MARPIGLVLAGGVGRRLGGPKGELPLGDRSLAERAGSALWPLCGSVLVSTRSSGPNPAPRFPAIVDPEPAGRGPLVGIDTAFDATGDADLLVLACDYPLVTADLLRCLVEALTPHDDVVLPSDLAGRDHPLVALWARPAAPAVRAAVREGRLKVRGLLADLRVHRLGPGDLPGIDLDRVLVNVNTGEDLARVAERDI
jgi:molybdopterin-guanine dinucleotide biosynthesis protein A